MNLQTKLAGLTLTSPLINAAGTCKLPYGERSVEELARSEAGAVVVGSYTVSPKTGNSGDIYRSDGLSSINAIGLTNGGADWLSQNLPQMVAIAHNAGKPLVVSVAGFSAGEYVELAVTAFDGGADAVELNLGCPNCWSDGEQNRILSFNHEGMDLTLKYVRDAIRVYGGGVLVKVSPYTDPWQLKQAAKVITKYSDFVQVVVTTNTIPNCLRFDDDDKPWIKSPEVPLGLGGGVGGVLLPLALGNVRQWREELPKHVQIIGVGGITCGDDMNQFRLAGADAMAIGTKLMDGGPKEFGEILSRYVEIAGLDV